MHSFFYLRISNQKGSSISKLIYCRPHVPIYLNLSNPITLHLYAVSNEHIFLQRLHYFSNTRLFLLLNKLYTLGVTFISFVFSFGHTISCSFGRNCFIIFSILDIDSHSDSQIKVVFTDNTGKVITDTGNITIPPVPADPDLCLPSKYVGYNLSMDFRNVVFENDGEYKTDIYFNNELLGTAPIFVKGRRQNGR